MNDWKLQGKSLISIPENAKAFIYKITFTPTGRYYIGYKLFYSKSTKKLGKRAIEQMVDKRKSKKVISYNESNWKEYKGSCKDPEYIELWNKHPNSFKREILQIVDKSDWSEKYFEKKHMILNDWESPLCYNGNFEGKIFKKKKECL